MVQKLYFKCPISFSCGCIFLTSINNKCVSNMFWSPLDCDGTSYDFVVFLVMVCS
jgi:hypothetical protein